MIRNLGVFLRYGAVWLSLGLGLLQGAACGSHSSDSPPPRSEPLPEETYQICLPGGPCPSGMILDMGQEVSLEVRIQGDGLATVGSWTWVAEPSGILDLSGRPGAPQVSIQGAAPGEALLAVSLPDGRGARIQVFVVAATTQDEDGDGVPTASGSCPDGVCILSSPDRNTTGGSSGATGGGGGRGTEPPPETGTAPTPTTGSETTGGPETAAGSSTGGTASGSGGTTPAVVDNCPTVPNPDQTDTNQNGIGDACDLTPGLWQMAPSLPWPYYDQAGATDGRYLYVSGGFGKGPFVHTPYLLYAPIQPDGTPGPWKTFHLPAWPMALLPDEDQFRLYVDTLPPPDAVALATVRGLDGHAMVVHKGFLYLIGGKFQYLRSDLQCNLPDPASCGEVTPEAWNFYVLVTPLDPDAGAPIGPWQAFPLPPQVGPYTIRAAVWNDILYLVGGWDGAAQRNTPGLVWAPLLPDGGVGAWTVGPSLPLGVSKHAVVAARGFLYSIGGNSGSAVSQDGYSQEFLDRVWMSPLAPDGIPGPWQETTPLPLPRLDHQALALDAGWILVIGGRDQNEYALPDGTASYTVLDTVIAARIGPDGRLGAWLPYNRLPGPRIRFALAATGTRAWVLGGSTGQEGEVVCISTAPCSIPYTRTDTVFFLDTGP